jgi:hypothetical protein
VECLLIVRRVKCLQPPAGDGSAQGELFATWRHHAFFANSTLPMSEADERHREHAIVEQVIAELKDGPLVHLPRASTPPGSPARSSPSISPAPPRCASLARAR